MNTYYIGLNDKDTKKQEISTDEAVKIIVDIIPCDFAFSICNGVYTHKGGTKVCEVTIKVESTKSLLIYMEEIKRKLNQECILAVYSGFDIERFI